MKNTKKVSKWVGVMWLAIVGLIFIGAVQAVYAHDRTPPAPQVNNYYNIITQDDFLAFSAANAAMDAIDFDQNIKGLQIGPGIGWAENGGKVNYGIAAGVGGRVCITGACGIMIFKFGAPESGGTVGGIGFTMHY
jgi:hypothetical protein